MKIPLILCLFAGFAVSEEEAGFVPLFDGTSLAGWTSARALAGEKSHFTVDPKEKNLHVYAGEEANSEQTTDCLNTEMEFSHFILRMEYQWLEKRFAPRTDWDRDAGLLFHVHGDLKKIWPLSLEMQIGESPGDKTDGKPPTGRFHSGDLFVIGKELQADTMRNGKFYDPAGEWVTGSHCPTQLGVEKPKGQWNQMEIRVHGAEKATFVLNGEVVHELRNLRQLNAQGEWVPLEKGRIGLQAEWSELLYRNIQIKELQPE